MYIIYTCTKFTTTKNLQSWSFNRMKGRRITSQSTKFSFKRDIFSKHIGNTTFTRTTTAFTRTSVKWVVLMDYQTSGSFKRSALLTVYQTLPASLEWEGLATRDQDCLQNPRAKSLNTAQDTDYYRFSSILSFLLYPTCYSASCFLFTYYFLCKHRMLFSLCLFFFCFLFHSASLLYLFSLTLLLCIPFLCLFLYNYKYHKRIQYYNTKT